jgi:hypothetical protein
MHGHMNVKFRSSSIADSVNSLTGRSTTLRGGVGHALRFVVQFITSSK